MAEYQAGDVLTLKVTVTKDNHGPIIKIGGRSVVVPGHPNHHAGGNDRLEKELIVGHTPAPPPPWVPAVGDIFKVKGSMNKSGRWKLICMDPDGDWVAQHMVSNYKSVVGKAGQYQFELDSSEN